MCIRDSSGALGEARSLISSSAPGRNCAGSRTLLVGSASCSSPFTVIRRVRLTYANGKSTVAGSASWPPPNRSLPPEEELPPHPASNPATRKATAKPAFGDFFLRACGKRSVSSTYKFLIFFHKAQVLFVMRSTASISDGDLQICPSRSRVPLSPINRLRKVFFPSINGKCVTACCAAFPEPYISNTRSLPGTGGGRED